MTQTDTIVDTLVTHQTITHKTCSVCEKVKPISCFGTRRTRGKTGFREDCKDCRNKIEKPKDKQRKRDIKIQCVEYLGGKCIRCGYNLPEAIDFHHIDPSTKSFSIGDVSLSFNDALKAELQKCAPLCKNCHAEFHAGRFDLEPYLHKIPKFNENTEKQDSTGDDLVLGIQISNFD
jgi:hypothetical protein